MSDVRLTATNPEDSSVVPVACNAKGELKLEEPIAPPEFDGNLDGDLTVSGTGSFAGPVEVGDRVFNSDSAYGSRIQLSSLINSQYGGFYAQSNGENINDAGNFSLFEGRDGNKVTFDVRADGTATFLGDVVVFSRNNQWMLVEQGGLCHMVAQTKISTADLVDPVSVPASTEYPKLRDVFAELDLLEQALEQVMEKLRMTEPDGWPVWDGSSNS